MSSIHSIRFSYVSHLLKFNFDAGTSRGVLREKTTYFIQASCQKFMHVGWGEAAPLVNLSVDDIPDFEEYLKKYCDDLVFEWDSSDHNPTKTVLDWCANFIPAQFPSIRFAFETALLDFVHGGKRLVFDTDFYTSEKPIPINGLIWMGEREFMYEQINEKLANGFTCIKMKIGAIDFEEECKLLEYIRSRFSADQITLRVDANGAFSASEALNKLKRLSEFQLHSIEQPIATGQWKEMAALCQQTPLSIALDEELIGIYGFEQRRQLLDQIKPQYIILKPSLVGGLKDSQEWIRLAEERGIGWWMTSALESNVGLNAIAQFTSTYQGLMHQGLGTGQLFTNNIDSPLVVKNGFISYKKELLWSEIS
ncbi:o-succinylbenzoate synthase [Mongoliitalea daihaiensis]|uniref:o-succinylbenzoate synthase n=1 Tax=Mongoliitalea daihaiensis TaxID=2782006 RepID=UPI001F45A83D|nr:o-succinylbenzoate synthase [Mongoliitalea daihaiensis]UJP64060.1 o-succinylbenzoate synthase [Mongoliitalea daihaiensis]